VDGVWLIEVANYRAYTVGRVCEVLAVLLIELVSVRVVCSTDLKDVHLGGSACYAAALRDFEAQLKAAVALFLPPSIRVPSVQESVA